MNIPVRIGMDMSKSVFQLHGVDQDDPADDQPSASRRSRSRLKPIDMLW